MKVEKSLRRTQTQCSICWTVSSHPALQLQQLRGNSWAPIRQSRGSGDHPLSAALFSIIDTASVPDTEWCASGLEMPPVQQLWTPAEHVLPQVQHPPFSLSTELTSSNFNVCLVLSDSIIVRRVNASLFTLYYNGCWKLKRATQEMRLSALLCTNINC